MTDPISATSLFVGATAGAQIHAVEQQKSAARASARKQEQANKVQRATTAVERSIKRRRAVAQARLAQQQNIAQASNLSITGSSPVQGAQSSIASNLATSFAQQNRQAVSGQQTFDLRQQAQNIEQRGRLKAQTTQAIGNVFQQGASLSAGFI